MFPRKFRSLCALLCAAICAFTLRAHPVAAQSEAAQQKTSPGPRTGSVLIFPFENNSHNPTVDWLGEGIAELTLERLSEIGVGVFSRQERLAALEIIGVPDSARFSHATMVKIAQQADADDVVFGDFVSDGKTITFEARVLQLSPARLSPVISEKGNLQDLLKLHSQMSSTIRCLIEQRAGEQVDCFDPEHSAPQQGPAPSVPSLDALQNFVRGILAMDDEPRARGLREASRLEPAWDRPPFELGRTYYEHKDCELALPWLSRVPPNRPDGAEAGFMTGVCHLLRNDAARAEASFTGLIDRSKSTARNERLPELPEAHNNLGIAYLRLENYPEAVTEFERATAIDAEEPNYWVNLGLARLAEKQPAAAVEPFQKAKELDPGDKGTRAYLIATYDLLGRTADAATLRAESPEKSAPVPLDPAALARLARVSMKLDRSALRGTQGSPGSDAPRKSAAKAQTPAKN